MTVYVPHENILPLCCYQVARQFLIVTCWKMRLAPQRCLKIGMSGQFQN